MSHVEGAETDQNQPGYAHLHAPKMADEEVNRDETQPGEDRHPDAPGE